MSNDPNRITIPDARIARRRGRPRLRLTSKNLRHLATIARRADLPSMARELDDMADELDRSKKKT